MLSLLATAGSPIVTAHYHPATLFEALTSAALFGALGIVLLVLGFKLFEWITPRVDIEKELGEKNMAVAAVVVALFVGLGYIVAHSITG